MAGETWKQVKLGSLLEEHQQRVAERADVPALSLTKRGGLVPAAERFARQLHGNDISNYRLVKRHDVVLDPMLLWDGAIATRWDDSVGFVSPDYRVYRATGRATSEYLDLAFQGHALRTEFKNRARGTNKRRNRIARAAFLDIPVSIPPLAEQQKIAEILGSVDAVIAATNALIEQTKQAKKGLLQELLTKGIGHTKFKQTPIGEMPESWDVRYLEETADVFNGKAPKTGGSWLRVFKTKHVYDGYVRMHDPEHVPDDLASGVDPLTYLQDGDVLTPNMAHATIGRVAWVPEAPPDSVCDGQVMVIRARPRHAMPRFLFDFFSSDNGRRTLLDREVGSIFGKARGQTHLYLKHVKRIRIPLPPLEEQARFGQLKAFDDAIVVHTARLRQLSAVKNGLLQDLLTGKVRVSA